MKKQKSLTRFFSRRSDKVAKDLIGSTIIVGIKGQTKQIVITETAAFEGSKKGHGRKEMLEAPGKIIPMSFYGRRLLYLATNKQGKASCVLISGAISAKNGNKKLSGAQVAKYLGIKRTSGDDEVGKNIRIELPKFKLAPQIVPSKNNASNCLGYFRAQG